MRRGSVPICTRHVASRVASGSHCAACCLANHDTGGLASSKVALDRFLEFLHSKQAAVTSAGSARAAAPEFGLPAESDGF